ncbi:thioredoxin-like protein [Cadophora sp. DSE1049]|nr:thioredoxin-like protein [Cadophora sp. DSE1049]
MVRITIDVIIDTACPFCYIALNHLTRAIERYESKNVNNSVAIRWHPLILQPNAPEAVDLSTYVAAIFGPEVRDNKLEGEEAMGRVEGIKFNRNRKLGSTYDAHRLIYLAGEKSSSLQTSVVRKLFQGHFEDGQAQSSLPFLVDTAVSSGIEKSEAVAWLESNAGGPEVEENIRKATAIGIRSVPHITVAEKYSLGSRYDEEYLLSTFERLGVE